MWNLHVDMVTILVTYYVVTSLQLIYPHYSYTYTVAFTEEDVSWINPWVYR